MRVRPRSRLQMHSGNDLNRWTVSFADFMTLMFAVFVVLFAVSSSQEEKYENIIQGIQEASNSFKKTVTNTNSESLLLEENNDVAEQPQVEEKVKEIVEQADNQLSHVTTLNEGAGLVQLKQNLENALSLNLKNKSIALTLDEEWLTIEMGGSLLFVGGSHALLNSAKEQIKKLVTILGPVNNKLRIRGYTDQQAISNEIYKSNWELAGARAFSVLHALNTLGIAEKRMVMEAYGQFNPVLDKDGNADRLLSRRVVIAISKYGIIEDEPAQVENKLSAEAPQSKIPAEKIAKPDREDMHEIRLPNNRLIITTRQE